MIVKDSGFVGSAGWLVGFSFAGRELVMVHRAISIVCALSRCVELMTLAQRKYLLWPVDGSRTVCCLPMTGLSSFGIISARRRARASDVKRRAKNSGLLYMVRIRVGR